MNMITVKVFSKERYDGEWPSENATEFMAWLSSKLAMVPPEFMHSAKIEIDSNSGYEGCSYPSIEIRYQRPETEEESSVRIQNIESRKAQQEEKERAEFERLKRKFSA